MTTDPYPDADPEEFVNVASVGPTTLRAAVWGYVAAREQYENGLMMAYREAEKSPAIFHTADLGQMAGLERFR